MLKILTAVINGHEKLVSVGDIALIFGVSRATVKRWANPRQTDEPMKSILRAKDPRTPPGKRGAAERFFDLNQVLDFAKERFGYDTNSGTKSEIIESPRKTGRNGKP